MDRSWRRSRRPAQIATVATTLVAFVLIATGVVGMLSAQPALAASSTLTVLGGDVAVRDGEGAFSAARDGQLVAAGMTVRTGPGSNAVLTYFDGSTVTVAPESELVIERLDATPDGDLVALARQAFGRTWHVVAHKLGPTGRYEVRTPAATAAVRGTAFEVAVEQDGTMGLTTTDGVVAVSGGGATVDVAAGRTTSVRPNAAPAAPTPARATPVTVRVTLQATPNAVVVDQSGRAVGVRNGRPLRYAPGSTVELVDGRLVIGIPTHEPGRISTIVAPEASGSPVDVQTEVLSDAMLVARTIERRHADGSGAAKGGIVLTTSGVIVLSDAEARRLGAPIIGDAPPAPRPSLARAALLLAAPGPLSAAIASGSAVPADGAFQPYEAGGGAALVRLGAEVPEVVLPALPPAKDGCAAFAAACVGVAVSAFQPAGSATPTRAAPLPARGLAVFTRPSASARISPASTPSAATPSPSPMPAPAPAPNPTPTYTTAPAVAPSATVAPTTTLEPLPEPSPTPTPTPTQTVTCLLGQILLDGRCVTAALSPSSTAP